MSANCTTDVVVNVSTLEIIGWVDEIAYALTLCLWIYNCYWLLIQKQRWHNEQIFLVYLFSFLILVSRIIFLIVWDVVED